MPIPLFQFVNSSVPPLTVSWMHIPLVSLAHLGSVVTEQHQLHTKKHHRLRQVAAQGCSELVLVTNSNSFFDASKAFSSLSPHLHLKIDKLDARCTTTLDRFMIDLPFAEYRPLPESSNEQWSHCYKTSHQ